MNALKQIAAVSGRTVIGQPDFLPHQLFLASVCRPDLDISAVVTLHQPRSDIYHLIDNVVVLAKGGRLAYNGPRSEVAAIFSKTGFPIPPLFNPADFLLDAVSNPTRMGRMIEIATAQQEQKKAVASENLPQQETRMYDNIDTEVLANTATRTPMYIALSVVVERMVKNLWRQQSSMSPTIFIHPVYLRALTTGGTQLALRSLLGSFAG